MDSLKESSEISIPFINKGKPFEVPTIKVSDIRLMQKKRANIKDMDPDTKEMESSIILTHSLLQKVDKSVTIEDIENWDYAEFVKFIKTLWDKNAENFRGIFPNLQMTPNK
jgi:hypothetical protein